MKLARPTWRGLAVFQASLGALAWSVNDPVWLGYGRTVQWQCCPNVPCRGHADNMRSDTGLPESLNCEKVPDEP